MTKVDPSSVRVNESTWNTKGLKKNKREMQTYRPSRISIVIDLDTTSLEARSLAVGAYLSMKRSPSLLIRYPPSPRQPSVIKQPAP